MPERQCIITGVGASAGGLEALKGLVSKMPEQSGVTLVVVQHLDPRRSSLMPELLARETRMPVEEARDGVKVEPGRVYILPPNASMIVKGGVLRVSSPIEHPQVATQIDHFLCALAEDRAEKSICVILSGAGNDGTVGLRAIKEHGGITIAQSPSSAGYESMPLSAISTGLVDYTLAPEEIPARLVEHAEYLARLERTKGIEALHQEVEDALPRVCSVLHNITGHDFSHYKPGTLVRRIERRIQLAHLNSVAPYLERLESDQKEGQHLFNDILIGVTQFFRDEAAFTSLGREVVPKLFEGKDFNTPIRIWVPGCATGEEAYSLGILLLEHMRKFKLRFDVQIFATDIDSNSLEVARRGRYGSNIVEHISEERLKHFFAQEADGFRVTKQLRDMCIFSLHDVVKDPPFSSLDLISCRNLLIYLEGDLQQRLLAMFHYALRPGGYLFLGPSEGLGSHESFFEVIDKKERISKRKENVVPPRIHLPFENHRMQKNTLQQLTRVDTAKKGHEVATRTFERMILEDYSFPGVMINSEAQILYSCGDTTRYLQQPVGAPSSNLFDVARKGLRAGLRLAFRRVLTTGNPAAQLNVSVKTSTGEEKTNLLIRPVAQTGINGKLFAVIFQNVAGIKSKKTPQEWKIESLEEPLVHELEHELQSLRGELQSTVVELETTNQDLKSSNEELLSMNEELQSANEELQTSKEEFQSINEELETVNNQLSRKVDELDEANSGLQNLFRSTQIASIFLDRELRIKRFTPAAAGVFHLRDGDIGRPISDLALPFRGVDLTADLRESLALRQGRERLISLGMDNASYMLRITPSLSTDNAVDGVIGTFVDVTSLRKAEMRLRRLYDSGMIGIIYWREGGWIDEANDKFFQTLGYARADLEKGLDLRQMTPPEYQHLDKHALAELRLKGVAEPYEKELVKKDGRRLPVLVGTARMDEALDHGVSFVLDISGLSSERAARTEAERANRMKDDFLATLSHELRTPLNAILGWSQLLARKRVEAEKAVPLIERSARAQAQLIEDLLDLGRLLVGKLQIKSEVVQLDEVIRGAVDMVEPAIREKGINLQVDLQPQMAPLQGDAARLQQVAWNLLTNAAKFTPEGGRIEVSLRQEGEAGVLRMIDTGEGIEADFVPHLFERFRQADPSATRKQKGLGIGLALAKHIVELHGGSIRAESPGKGQGAIFTIELPLSGGRSYPSLPDKRAIARPPEGLSILIVEDEPDCIELLTQLLADTRPSITAALSAKAALESLKHTRPQLIISDIGMANMDGYAFIKAVRALGHNIPVIAVTAFAREEDRARALEAGFDRHIAKPIDQVVLLKAIADLFSIRTEKSDNALAPSCQG